jgi:LysR family transcriptional regulator, glycine cleavage system transcriptional activator
MPKKLPPLGALRAFEAASRHISFVRAAEELSVSPAAISHQIKLLEHWVGAKLFERAARGVSLSRAGQEYASGVREIFDRLISTSASLRKNRARKVVHIRAQFSLATSWLLPRVVRFNQANTDIEIQLSALNFDRNPSKGGADIALYHQRQDIAGYTQQILISGKYKVYAAPSLLARYESSPPASLLTRPLLHTSGVTGIWQVLTLHDWFVESGVTPPATLPGMHFNLEHITTSACIQGAGYALLLDELVLDSARAGSLIAIDDLAMANPHPYTLMKKKVTKDEVSAVSDWLLSGVQGD